MNNDYIVNLLHSYIEKHIKNYKLLVNYKNVMYVYIFANELEAYMNDNNIKEEEKLIEYIEEHLWNSQEMIDFWEEVEEEREDSFINGINSIRNKRNKV